ncbi:hypothetical protein [Mesorhizobium mediterraneum]|nr:hypothetical protein [Mesorhizobium mediterraneum]
MGYFVSIERDAGNDDDDDEALLHRIRCRWLEPNTLMTEPELV